MVRFPSGMLSFAALAVAAPIAEEVFFRGLVYATLRGRGGWFRELWAISGSWVFFALGHLPQDWGNWGGLVAVLVAGLGFTMLRSLAGSTLVSCLAHLVYNGLLVLGELLPGEVG
jgi:membrane protease YdiL (CAAX protease family)